MSQHDLDIANQTRPSLRADLNNALQALGSSMIGASAPPAARAGMLWYDTAGILKVRNSSNTAWISMAVLDTANGEFRLIADTKVNDGGGDEIGRVGLHDDLDWQAGTEGNARLISPASLKAAIEARIDAYNTETYSPWATSWVFPHFVAHNFGAQPRRHQVQLRSKVASASHGLAVNDVFDVTSRPGPWSKVDATLGSVFSQDGSNWEFRNGAGFVIAGTSANFDIRFIFWPPE